MVPDDKEEDTVPTRQDKAHTESMEKHMLPQHHATYNKSERVLH